MAVLVGISKLIGWLAGKAAWITEAKAEATGHKQNFFFREALALLSLIVSGPIRLSRKSPLKLTDYGF